MKTLKTTAIRRNGSARNGNGNGHTKGMQTATKAREADKRSGNDLTLKIVETTPKTLTIQISGDRQPARKPVSPWLNPTQLERPAFLMNYPFSYATGFANNPWMTDMKDDKRQPDFVRAAVQFLAVYQNISAEGLVYLLPTPQGAELQDLMYTANLGIVLDHLPDKNTVVVSNFASVPRRGETPVGVKFFEDMGYNVHIAPTKFEGEAELKHLYDNIYVGG